VALLELDLILAPLSPSSGTSTKMDSPVRSPHSLQVLKLHSLHFRPSFWSDFGVGAPDEGGEGAVYIYHGKASFGKRQPLGQPAFAQKIRPSRDAGLSLRGFGASISGGVDLDGNGTPGNLFP